jgi:transposase-like protein
MSKESKEPMNVDVSPAMGEALEGARRATVDASPIVPPNPEVAATARRRQFTSVERARILNAADACKAPGEIGALLRREGIYSSLLATWRKQSRAAQRSALESQKRGPKVNPSLAQTHEVAQLTRDNERLRRQLAQAHTIIEVQKKVSSLLGLLTDEKLQGAS